MVESECTAVRRSAATKLIVFLRDLLLLDYALAYRTNSWRGVRNLIVSSWRNAYIILKGRTSRRVECPCCGWKGFDFSTLWAGGFIQDSCICFRCGAQQRQRALRLYLDGHDEELKRREGLLLHTAPEPSLGEYLDTHTRFARIGVDLEPDKLRVAGCPAFRADLCSISLPNDCVDALLCLHVLEHIRDDRQPIAEFHRVLKSGAIAYFMVPMMPAPRRDTEEYGRALPQVFDHWRTYGLDFRERLVGFDVEQICPDDFLTPEDRMKFGIGTEEIIHRCVKR